MQPLVSVIVPCFNENRTISLLLDALRQQTYPLESVEVLVADGRSTDGTRETVSQYAAGHPDQALQVIDNPRRTIPAALNLAIQAARGDIIVRLDAHSRPQADYIERCVAALQAGKGQNVGGVWEIQPGRPGWVAKSIAIAAAHPLGVGDALYRLRPAGDSAGRSVDTVPFGAYWRSLVAQIGPYDETLLTNEDYEFNVRIRRSGGQVWLDPAIRSVYFARSTFGSLWRQYWRYGYWKAQMLRRYPATLRWRQALPPAFVLAGAFLLLAALWIQLAQILLAVQCLGYLSVLLLAGAQVALRRKDPRLLAGVPLAIASMHLAWGSAFWFGLSGIFS
jgi:glycosyltransferase involved in cell wall biosynthesis